MKRVYLWMLAGMMLLLAGCATEDAVGRGVQDVSLTVDDVPNRWTYVSLSAREVVGSSSLGDTREDALWMMRTDWDIWQREGWYHVDTGGL